MIKYEENQENRKDRKMRRNNGNTAFSRDFKT